MMTLKFASNTETTDQKSHYQSHSSGFRVFISDFPMGGVIGQQEGGMAHDPDATMKHLMLLCKQGV